MRLAELATITAAGRLVCSDWASAPRGRPLPVCSAPSRGRPPACCRVVPPPPLPGLALPGAQRGPHRGPRCLVRRLSVVPYGRMQFVEVTAGPIERTLRAVDGQAPHAAAASDARIPGLDRTRPPGCGPPHRPRRGHGGGHVSSRRTRPPRTRGRAGSDCTRCRRRAHRPAGARPGPAHSWCRRVHSRSRTGRPETDYLVVFTLVSAVSTTSTGSSPDGTSRERRCASRPLIRQDSRGCHWPGSRPSTWCGPCWPASSASPSCASAWPDRFDGRPPGLPLRPPTRTSSACCLLAPATPAPNGGAARTSGTAHGRGDRGRLLGSVLLVAHLHGARSDRRPLALLDQFDPGRGGRHGGFLAIYLLSFAGVVWRRLSGQYAFIASRVLKGSASRGLLQTIAETVPYGRIQAVRQVEPLLWRPFGWCRLEVDVAGATARNQRGEGTA